MARLNRADYLLGVVALLFLLFLCLRLKFGANIILDGAFFCTEAALAGGIADWFAVTALFKKPLGFPYHTALIPRKREQLMENCIHLVQREFFSRKSLLVRLKKENLTINLLAWLAKGQGRDLLQGFIAGGINSAIANLNAELQAEEIAAKLKAQAENYPLAEIIARLTRWLKENDYGAQGLDNLLAILEERVKKEETRAKIIAAIQGYIEEQSKNPLFALMFMFAKSADVLNFAEAAAVIQNELVKLINDLKQEDNAIRQRVLTELAESLQALSLDEAFLAQLNELRGGILAAVDLKAPLRELIERGREKAIGDGEFVEKLAASFAENLLAELGENKQLRQRTEEYLYDLAGRAILQAQALLGLIVKSAMKKLSDEQLNEIIYSKVSSDLIWIRMNGSIVGAVIGLFLFIMTRVFG
jgi:uncharacterized membrane-anchored protein YjiN (DUF445 family)